MITRLTYHERMKSVLPAFYPDNQVFPSEAPRPNFTFATKTESEVDAQVRIKGETKSDMKTTVEIVDTDMIVDDKLESIALELLQSIKNKSPTSDLQQILDQIQESESQHELLVECLLMTSSRSFSHVQLVIERNIDLLKHYNSTTHEKQKTLEIIGRFWSGNSHYFETCIFKLVDYGVIDIDTLIQFGVGLLNDKCNAWVVWSLIKGALNKANLLLTRVQCDANASILYSTLNSHSCLFIQS